MWVTGFTLSFHQDSRVVDELYIMSSSEDEAKQYYSRRPLLPACWSSLHPASGVYILAALSSNVTIHHHHHQSSSSPSPRPRPALPFLSTISSLPSPALLPRSARSLLDFGLRLV